MGVERKQYSREFKIEAVRLITEGKLSIAQAARDLGINDNMLSRWKKELEQNSQQDFSVMAVHGAEIEEPSGHRLEHGRFSGTDVSQ